MPYGSTSSQIGSIPRRPRGPGSPRIVTLREGKNRSPSPIVIRIQLVPIRNRAHAEEGSSSSPSRLGPWDSDNRSIAALVTAVALGAACAFASPVTYQTHLLVYGPGGYRFTDFARVGLPLDLICAAVAITLIPMIWPLTALLHAGPAP